MKIYTKTGDTGETSLFGGGRVQKDHARIGAYGDLDELNAVLGVARAEAARDERLDDAWRSTADDLLGMLQHRLFDLGSELATPDAERRGMARIDDRCVGELESEIDRHEATLPALKEFVLPGGSPSAAQLHVARCVCRRAERSLVAMSQQESVRPIVLRYVNRLSDLLFVLARGANHHGGGGDVAWRRLD